MEEILEPEKAFSDDELNKLINEIPNMTNKDLKEWLTLSNDFDKNDNRQIRLLRELIKERNKRLIKIGVVSGVIGTGLIAGGVGFGIGISKRIETRNGVVNNNLE